MHYIIIISCVSPAALTMYCIFKFVIDFVYCIHLMNQRMYVQILDVDLPYVTVLIDNSVVCDIMVLLNLP